MSDYKRFVIDDLVYEDLLVPVLNEERVAESRPVSWIQAAIPGIIEAIQVERGQSVKRGERLLILGAATWQREILAPRDGIVRALAVARGQRVNRGETLLQLD